MRRFNEVLSVQDQEFIIKSIVYYKMEIVYKLRFY